MAEKLEQSKEFIEEFELLRRSTGQWVFTALLTMNNNVSEYPTLYKWLFTGTFDEDNANQITFAKIWAGEIELVEKKPKYVIWAKGSLEGDRAEFLYNNALHAHISAAILRKTEAADDKECHFDQEFAFALRDTKRFEIDKVVE